MVTDNVSGVKGTTESPAQKLRREKNEFNLHVMLIMQADSVTKNVALFRAWCEGPSGLGKRLNPGGRQPGSEDQGDAAKPPKP